MHKALTISATLALFPYTAFAMECEGLPISDERKLEDSDMVFTGTVLEVYEQRRDGVLRCGVEIEPWITYKGAPPAKVTVWQNDQRHDKDTMHKCGKDWVIKGEKYLFYLDDLQNLDRFGNRTLEAEQRYYFPFCLAPSYVPVAKSQETIELYSKAVPDGSV